MTFDDVDLAAGGATTVTVAAGGVSVNALSFSSANNNYTIGGGSVGVTAGTGVTKNLAGVATLNANVTTPTTTINAGELLIGSGATYNSTTLVTVAGGTLGVAGTLNTPTLTVNPTAVLSVASTGALGPTTALFVNGLAGFSTASGTIGSLNGAGLATLNGTVLTLGAMNMSGTLNGTGALVYNLGGSTTAVNSAATLLYSGSTTINGPGTLRVSADANFSNTALAAGIQLNNANLEITAGGGGFATGRGLDAGKFPDNHG